MSRYVIFLLFFGLLRGVAHAQTPALPGHLAAPAHRESVLAFQQNLNKEFHDPQESPLTPAEQQRLKTLPFYPTDYAYYVEATLVRDSVSQPFAMETSTDRRPLYRKFGELHFVLNGQPQHLSVYQGLDLMKRPDLTDYLFVPFTDLTNGHGSYGGGRYLDLRVPPAGTAILQLDFNRAYNPSCAYNHGYSCPVPPAENRLAVAIPAGVQSDH